MRNHRRATRAFSRFIHQSARFTVESLERRALLSAGDLDPTFGIGGKLLVSDGTPSAYHLIQTTAIQSDGKILLAGSAGADISHLNTFFLERLNTNGTPDSAFGSGGIVTTSFGPGFASGASLVIQSDNSIVLGGTYEPDSTANTAQFAVARYTSAGVPDGTFGIGGKVTTIIPGHEQLASISLAPGNKIVAVGGGEFQDPAHPTDPAYSTGVYDIARYNANGTPDITLNQIGYVYRQLGGNTTVNSIFNASLAAAAVQSDGKILVGGGFSNDLAVWRFNVDGSLDTSFGLAGRALDPLQFYSFDSFQTASVSKMVIQPNGQILVAGSGFDEGANRNFTVIGRFNSDGWIDTSFGDDGVVIPPDSIVYGAHALVGGLNVQSDGKIVMTGAAPQYSTFGGLMARRLLANGATDPSFNSFQIEYFSDGHNGLTGASGAMAPNGSIYVVGNDNDTSGTSGIFVTRLQNDSTPVASASIRPQTVVGNPSGNLPGDLDASFGILGRTEFNDPSPVELPNATTFRVKATAVLSSGQILLAGSTGTIANDGQGQFFLERLNADGTIDTNFGTNGSVVTSIGNFSFATSLLVQSDGKIVLGGATVDSLPNISSASFALARYNSNGLLDTTFGSAGKEITDFPGNEEIDSIAFGPGGTIVAAGSYFNYPNVGFDIARYTPAGLLDTSFNSTGMVSKDLGQTGSNSKATAVAVQSDGKVVIGSHLNSEYALYRFNVNGSPDDGFGAAGVATTAAAFTNPSTGVAGAVTKLVIQPDGKIVAAGATSFSYTPHSLARFNLNGSLDGGFGTKGVVTLSENVVGNIVQSDLFTLASLILQPDGEIILVGNQRSNFGEFVVNPGGAPLVRKLLPNGSADPHFTIDQDPFFIPPPPFYPSVVFEGAALAPTGQLIVVANVSAGQHWLGVARYLNDANTITVTSLVDDGSVGTLRWALDRATTVQPSSIVVFSAGLTGSIFLSSPIVETGNANGNVWIFGPGALNVSIHGNIGTAGSVYVSGLTLFNGGIASPKSQSYTDATVHGGLSPSSSYSILRSSLLGDGTAATALSAGSDPHTLSKIDTSTITGYTSTAIIGGPYLDIISSTISGNGGLGLASNSSSVDDSIIAGNGAVDVSGLVWSYGYNLIGAVGTSVGWVSTDLTGTTAAPINPQLLPLGYYYGPTPTLPPRQGSPAVGNGGVNLRRSESATDQRGIFIDIYPGAWDIGSVRAQYAIVNGSAGNDSISFSANSGFFTVSVNQHQTFATIMTVDPLATITLNGNGGADTIGLDYSSGQQPLPHFLALNGTFTITGLQGTNPFAGSTIDLTQSTLYFSYVPGQSPTSLIQQALKAGYNNGTWTGSGAGLSGAFTSSAAAINSAKFALGYADSADGYIAGQPANTIEIRYTVAGDTNLDRVVNLADAARMQSNFNTSGFPSWDRGNFNYDNSINSTDAVLLVRNYNAVATGSVAAPIVVATPTVSQNVATPPAVTSPTTNSTLITDTAPIADKHHKQPKKHPGKHQ